MALRALAEAGRLLDRPDLIDSARNLARFLLTTMTRDGQLRHAWRDGSLRRESYLSDYAQVGLGLLELHGATGELAWLQSAHQITLDLNARFHVDGSGFYDSEPGDLPIRARDLYDGAVPSGSAAACELLLRLAGIFERSDWAEIARATIARQTELIAQAPEAAPAMLHAHLLSAHGVDLALPVQADGSTFAAAAQAEFAPLATIAIGSTGAVPVLNGRRAGAAYLCRYGACQLPATTIEQLRDQLARAHLL